MNRMIVFVVFLFWQGGLLRPVESGQPVKPWVSTGVMLTKGRWSADLPFVQVTENDGKPKWLVALSVRYVLPLRFKK